MNGSDPSDANASRVLLLVEDNDQDILIMKRVLRHAGVRNPLHIVKDGDKAIDYLSANGRFADRSRYPLPAIVFLDLKLPLMSGHEVLTWIRQREGFNSIVVVVLTGSDDPTDLRRAHRLGANSYLVKPPTSDQLLEMARAFNWHWLECNSSANV